MTKGVSKGVVAGTEERSEKIVSILRAGELPRAQMYPYLGSQYHMMLTVVE